MTLVLRPYQQDVVHALHPFEPGKKHLAVVPTGGGKSLIVAQLAHDAWLLGQRTLIITHVQELVEQNALEITALDPTLDVGVYCAGLGKREVGKPITVASIQSIYKRLDNWIDIGLVIVDEAHRISAQGGKMYRAVLNAFKHAYIVGLTATPFRTPTGYLHKGEHAIFDRLAAEVSYEVLVADGWLAPIVDRGSDLAYNTDKIHVKAGEFVQAELDGLVDYPKTKRIVEQALARSADRRFKLCFAINLRHCGIIQQVLTELGKTAIILHGGMTRDERKEARDLFELGLIDVAINCNIWGTGYNFRNLDCIWLLRPTESVGFFIQIVGRLTRTSEFKTDGLLLDYGGNVSRHGHFSKPEVHERRKSGATKSCNACGETNSVMVRYCLACSAKFNEMFKDCPECGDEADRMAQTCPQCHYGWPVSEKKLDEKGDTILPNGAQWVNVIDWNCYVHKKEGSPYKSFVIRYKTVDNGTIQEYVFPEHPSTKAKFAQWWKVHTNGKFQTPPQSASEAYARRNQLACPGKIEVCRSGKFYAFFGRDFGIGVSQLRAKPAYKQAAHLNSRGNGAALLRNRTEAERKLQELSSLDELPF